MRTLKPATDPFPVSETVPFPGLPAAVPCAGRGFFALPGRSPGCGLFRRRFLSFRRKKRQSFRPAAQVSCSSFSPVSSSAFSPCAAEISAGPAVRNRVPPGMLSPLPQSVPVCPVRRSGYNPFPGAPPGCPRRSCCMRRGRMPAGSPPLRWP